MKKKLSMIVGKKQIILASLTLILAIAIYLNFIYAQMGGGLPTTELTDSEEHYGDTMMVSGSADSEKDDGEQEADAGNNENAEEVDATAQANEDADAYFALARLDKMKTRDEAFEKLDSIFNGGDLTMDELAMVGADAVSLTDLMESESKIENLIKAQGFEDCLVYLDDTSANIIVKTPGLEASQAAQIKDILLSEVAIESEFITIVEVN